MKALIAVALGGATGALVRYSVYLLVNKWIESPAPLATWTVNLVGCLLIGFLAPFMNTSTMPAQWRLFILVGFLGSFTTFSTFSLESMVLWQEGREGLVLLNAVGSVVAGIALVWLGMQLHKGLLGQ
ncbi:MAG: fluoride efflux transporter CrcB [Rhodothermaceae bacterium]|nr:fluoride efflux transporter CrcB [Rhodothermaceae bacterium]